MTTVTAKIKPRFDEHELNDLTDEELLTLQEHMVAESQATITPRYSEADYQFVLHEIANRFKETTMHNDSFDPAVHAQHDDVPDRHRSDRERTLLAELAEIHAERARIRLARRHRDDDYHDPDSQTLRDFLNNQLDGFNEDLLSAIYSKIPRDEYDN